MKEGLLVRFGDDHHKNIGDYVQSLAAKQFSNNVEHLIEIEKIGEFNNNGEKVKVIVNGWFMHHPEQWPPSQDIDPLIISFHITPSAEEGMLNAKSINWYKQHEPIGCRDIRTMRLLQEKGVDAYYSSCLTLTLNKDDRIVDNSICCFVDPYFDSYREDGTNRVKPFRVLYGLILYYMHRRKIDALSSIANLDPEIDFNGAFEKILSKLHISGHKLAVAFFYNQYSKMFSDEILFNARYYSSIVDMSKYKSHDELFDRAKFLLSEYSHTNLVVTSRIHCALPCLSFQTPVIYVYDDLNDKSSHHNGRFEGILELFNVMHSIHGKLTLSGYNFIDKNTKISNKSTYLEYKEKLIKRCSDFMKK